MPFALSRECGRRGWIGSCWPEEYGGRSASALEKYVIAEELLAGGAPVGAHWAAERQSGDQILRYGSMRIKRLVLPRIAAGECYFSVGMSEADAGSDLASARTRAERVAGGWSITGAKVWTSNAHRAHYMITLARTSPKTQARHEGFTEFIIDMAAPGVVVRPIYNLAGLHDFNEVVFDNYFVPDDMVVGEVGNGWQVVTGELAYERSGPDRFMSTFQLLLDSIRVCGTTPDDHTANEIGRLIAHFATLRQMSVSIAGMLQQGLQPAVEAALVKDLGTAFEREIPERFRQILQQEPSLGDGAAYPELLGAAILDAPSFTIRGGTREVLRGIIARALGLR
ncbi:MAG: acyl-CoA dehydrogenase [Betaproteobacteria bacterium]|nr:acyl-CoA dehydrogenase [Betaproteobacteria bacterium]